MLGPTFHEAVHVFLGQLEFQLRAQLLQRVVHYVHRFNRVARVFDDVVEAILHAVRPSGEHGIDRVDWFKSSQPKERVFGSADTIVSRGASARFKTPKTTAGELSTTEACDYNQYFEMRYSRAMQPRIKWCQPNSRYYSVAPPSYYCFYCFYETPLGDLSTRRNHDDSHGSRGTPLSPCRRTWPRCPSCRSCGTDRRVERSTHIDATVSYRAVSCFVTVGRGKLIIKMWEIGRRTGGGGKQGAFVSRKASRRQQQQQRRWSQRFSQHGLCEKTSTNNNTYSAGARTQSKNAGAARSEDCLSYVQQP